MSDRGTSQKKMLGKNIDKVDKGQNPRLCECVSSYDISSEGLNFEKNRETRTVETTCAEGGTGVEVKPNVCWKEKQKFPETKGTSLSSNEVITKEP